MSESRPDSLVSFGDIVSGNAPDHVRRIKDEIYVVDRRPILTEKGVPLSEPLVATIGFIGAIGDAPDRRAFQRRLWAPLIDGAAHDASVRTGIVAALSRKNLAPSVFQCAGEDLLFSSGRRYVDGMVGFQEGMAAVYSQRSLTEQRLTGMLKPFGLHPRRETFGGETLSWIESADPNDTLESTRAALLRFLFGFDAEKNQPSPDVEYGHIQALMMSCREMLAQFMRRTVVEGVDRLLSIERVSYPLRTQKSYAGQLRNVEGELLVAARYGVESDIIKHYRELADMVLGLYDALEVDDKFKGQRGDFEVPRMELFERVVELDDLYRRHQESERTLSERAAQLGPLLSVGGEVDAALQEVSSHELDNAPEHMLGLGPQAQAPAVGAVAVTLAQGKPERPAPPEQSGEDVQALIDAYGNAVNTLIELQRRYSSSRAAYKGTVIDDLKGRLVTKLGIEKAAAARIAGVLHVLHKRERKQRELGVEDAMIQVREELAVFLRDERRCLAEAQSARAHILARPQGGKRVLQDIPALLGNDLALLNEHIEAARGLCSDLHAIDQRVFDVIHGLFPQETT